MDHYITNTLNFYVGDPNPTIMEEIPCGAKLFHFFELTGIFLANKGRHSSYNCWKIECWAVDLIWYKVAEKVARYIWVVAGAVARYN